MLLYSIKNKICIILELTCCCEENIEDWHKKKFLKYDPLSKSIVSNGWEVHLFPVEVGARGYCGSSVKSCFSRLGFSRKLVRSLMKSLSLAAIKSSFFIWQSRDSKVWNNPVPSPSVSNPTTVSDRDQHSQQQLQVRPENKSKFSTSTCKSSHLPSKHKVTKLPFIPRGNNVGLINKGNTCYINSCLQCISTMPEFWSKLSLSLEKLSPFVLSFLKTMSLLKTSKFPADPSHLLRVLK